MKKYDLIDNNYGFIWGEVLVERTCSSIKNPKFQVMRIYAPNGDCVEILMRPRSTKVSIHPNLEMKKK